jgi:hypothetical protein
LNRSSTMPGRCRIARPTTRCGALMPALVFELARIDA